MFWRKDECAFLGLIAVYIVLCGMTAARYGLLEHFHPIMYMDSSLIVSVGVFFIFLMFMAGRAYYIMLFKRPPKLTQALWAELKAGPLNKERYIRALPVFIGLVFFLSTFTSMKQMIPGINPFSWDQYFADLDRTIHFGIDPWRILQPLLGHPVITWGVNIVYNFWLMALFLMLYWQMFSLRDSTVRMRFFVTFVLAWAINGTLLATLLSSAGPCFFERLIGSDYYAPLMDYLRHTDKIIPLFAVSTQDSVWDAVKNNQSMIGGGISAMPSVHVTTALLFLLTARALKLKAWPLFAVFLGFIMVGSIHLGWHYALDGYLAIVTTIILWFTSGKILTWLNNH